LGLKFGLAGSFGFKGEGLGFVLLSFEILILDVFGVWFWGLRSSCLLFGSVVFFVFFAFWEVEF
jgi:hypothetical protein